MFIEALIENFIDIVGWSEELGFWLSSLATSIREVKGALGQLALGSLGPDIKNDIALLKDAINAGDMKTEADMRQRIEQTLQKQQEAESEKQEERKTWERLLKSGFFKGIFMVLPAVLFGSFTFLTLKGLSSVGKGAISLAPEKFAAFKAKINVFKKGKIPQVSGEHSSSSLYDSLQKQMKKPSEIDGEALNNLFRGQQETEKESPPLMITFPDVNYNPKQVQRADLFKKFKEISLVNDFGNSEYAVETFKILYPNGYGGFRDPILGLGQWARERGIDASYLSFWGGLPNDFFELKEALEEFKQNEKRLEEYDDYVDFDISSLSIFKSPSKEMTIREYLTDELHLTDRILEYNIYVNGKEVKIDDLDYWSNLKVSPSDGIAITPYVTLERALEGAAGVHNTKY